MLIMVEKKSFINKGRKGGGGVKKDFSFNKKILYL